MILSTLLVLAAGTADAQPTPAPIDAVTVHADRARVVRRTALLSQDGTYRVEGLTGSLDAASLRARVAGGHVLSVELRPHEGDAPPSERIALLAEEQRLLDAERAEVLDEAVTLETLAVSIERLEQTGKSSENRVGAGDPAVFDLARRFLVEQAAIDQATRRALELRVADIDLRQADLDRRKGALQAPQERSFDVLLDLDLPSAGAVLEVEYLVPASGWEPRYELRTTSDARSVQVTYRARVWQESGEDWEGVQLSLSTAQPRRGAAAPELATRWARTRANYEYARGLSSKPSDSMNRLGYLNDDAPAKAPSARLVAFASIRDEGLSLRYELPSTDSVLSGDGPTNVLIGTSVLGIEPEYHCVPALDTTVWLRGRATNDSAFTFLPGEASVFFGEDHLGRADLDTVRPGQEFTLHLGLDPALAVERRMIDEGTKDPGFFGSKSTWHRTWSVRVTNHGAAIVDSNGVADVFIREALPRSTDERVSVTLEDSNQPAQTGARWDADRAEQGIETWLLRVPRAGEAELRYELRIRHPEGGTLEFR